MKKFFLFLTFFFSLFFTKVTVFASESTPAIVLNFASMNEFDWAAPEEKWQAEVKPKVVSQIRQMRNTLTTNSPTPNVPILAWSTLMEYMNFPMDTPSPDSPYVVKMRRILQIAEEENFPVFVPLNGFQWWDELPELYNWWDSDGTKTDPAFFARQDNPEDFKRRFIAGYNPDNIHNVEWQTPTTPMRLNYRNWGGGGFRLAPPPNLVDHDRTQRTYRSVQRERLQAIVQVIAETWDKWKQQGKEHLFVGLSIGTEVSLNASVTPADEFIPYGYKGIADIGQTPFRQSIDPYGLTIPNDSQARIAVIHDYFLDNARLITRFGIPNYLIYTHVLGEQDATDKSYSGIARGAFNFYSRPGVSLYGYAKNPTGSQEWMNEIEGHGSPEWGILEYNAGSSQQDWLPGLSKAVAVSPLTVIYNYDGIAPQAIPAIKSVLTTPLQPMPAPQGCTEESAVYAQPGLIAGRFGNAFPIERIEDLPHGIFSVYTMTTHCDGHTTTTTPRVVTVPVSLPADITPAWVRWILDNTRL